MERLEAQLADQRTRCKELQVCRALPVGGEVGVGRARLVLEHGCAKLPAGLGQ